ncbi:Nop52-domain-containing protein [Hypoxylon sp. FL1857]|nr:Nop52-domain-containing protein [Hypoxylon sp. FL1857]
MAADERNMPFIKHLASSDRKTRSSALSTLRTFLTAPTTARKLSDLDHLKLWKGLFYSVWMCDRPIPQQNLCAELADLLSVLPAPKDNEGAVVIPFLQAFWATLAREWTAIDVLRMEKYLLLVRRVFGASLAWVGNGKDKNGTTWAGTRANGMLQLLEEWPLEKTGNLSTVPVGLRLHVLDIWVDEAEKAELLKEKEGSGSSEGSHDFLSRLRHMVEAQSKSPCKPVQARAKESLADERLPWNEVDSPDKMDDGHNDRGSWDGFDD